MTLIGLKSHFALRARYRAGRRNTIVQAARKQSAKPDSESLPPARLSKILKMYQDKGLAAQQDQLEDYIAVRDIRPREERLSAGSAYVERSEEFTDKQNILYRTNELGRRVQDIGGFGRGQPQWWALWVKEGREKQVADALHRRTPFLPALELNPAHFGFDIEAMEAAASQGRKLETWVPEKKVRAWNPKTNKMGNKIFKYDEGGWVFMNTILDRHLNDYVQRNVNVLGFRDKERFEGSDYPQPCSPEKFAEVKAWEADLSDIDEDQMRAMLGLPPRRSPDWEDLQEQNEAAFWEQEERRAQADGRRGGRGGARGGRGGQSRGGGTTRDRQRVGLYSDDDGGGKPASGGWYEGGAGLSDDDFDTSSWFTGDDDAGNLDGWFSTPASASSDDDTSSSANWRGETRERREPRQRRSRRDDGDASDSDGRASTGGGSGGLSSWFDEAAAAYEAAAIDTSTTGSEDVPAIQDDMWSSESLLDFSASGGANDTTDTPAPKDDMWAGSDGGAAGFGGWLDDFPTPSGKSPASSTSFYSENAASGGAGNRRSDAPRDFSGDRGGNTRDRGDRQDRSFDDRRGRQTDRRERGNFRDRRDSPRYSSDDRRDRGGNTSSQQWSESGPRSGGRYDDNRDSGNTNFGGTDLSWWDEEPGSSSAAPKSDSSSWQLQPSDENDFAAVYDNDSNTDNYNNVRGGAAAAGREYKSKRSSDDRGTSQRRGRRSDEYGDSTRSSTFDAAGSSDRGSEGDASFAAGSSIMVTGGPFQDFDGVVIDKGGKRGTVRAELDVFGKPTVVEVEVKDIKPNTEE